VETVWKLRVGAEAYYLSQVARGLDEYYTGAGEAPGVWTGGGIGALGLTGEVDPADLRAVLAGLVPGTGLSPNGATLAQTAAELGPIVITGCLRNARAVARAARSVGGVVTVIAAGERWDDGDALRPAVEDLLGAGAILSALKPAAPSPEARAAIAAFEAAAPGLVHDLMECASGRELIERGFAHDVALAAELHASGAVPLLRERAFGDWRL
jgi:2-phosphosulfolactate phosphatase